MVDELKIIAEIFRNATDGALYAYIAYIVYQLAKVSIIVFPVIGAVKLFINKVFISEDK